MLNDLSQMIETPELLRLSLRIRRHKPRQTKRTLLDRQVGIREQLILDIRAAELTHDVLSSLLAECLRQRSANVHRILDCFAFDPKLVVAFMDSGIQLLWMVELDCTQSALDL